MRSSNLDDRRRFRAGSVSYPHYVVSFDDLHCRRPTVRMKQSLFWFARMNAMQVPTIYFAVALELTPETFNPRSVVVDVKAVPLVNAVGEISMGADFDRDGLPSAAHWMPLLHPRLGQSYRVLLMLRPRESMTRQPFVSVARRDVTMSHSAFVETDRCAPL